MAGHVKHQRGRDRQSCNNDSYVSSPAMCCDYGRVSAIHPDNAAMRLGTGRARGGGGGVGWHRSGSGAPVGRRRCVLESLFFRCGLCAYAHSLHGDLLFTVVGPGMVHGTSTSNKHSLSKYMNK